MNLKKIFDASSFRKGDILAGKIVGNMKVQGPLVEVTPEGYRIQGESKNTFYTITKESAQLIQPHVPSERKLSESSREKIYEKMEALQDQIDILEEEYQDLEWNLERVSLDMEQDPDVLADPDNGDNPAVIEYGNQMTDIQNQMQEVRTKIESLQEKWDKLNKRVL